MRLYPAVLITVFWGEVNEPQTGRLAVRCKSEFWIAKLFFRRAHSVCTGSIRFPCHPSICSASAFENMLSASRAHASKKSGRAGNLRRKSSSPSPFRPLAAKSLLPTARVPLSRRQEFTRVGAQSYTHACIEVPTHVHICLAFFFFKWMLTYHVWASFIPLSD